MHIALVNDGRWIAPEQPDWYAQQIIAEDQYLVDALQTLDATVSRVDWADQQLDWSACDAIIIRQTWDYFERFTAFQTWLDTVEQLTRIINPAEVLRWNWNKRYLCQLAEHGVPTVPTQYVAKGDKQKSLSALMSAKKWDQAVIKPAVSGAGRETYRVGKDNMPTMQAHWMRLLDQEDMLLQPFMRDILTRGEVSLMLMGGSVTHAVQKTAAPGEFRVQDDHGGSVKPYQPTAAEIQLAEHALTCTPLPVSYARVDMINTAQGAQIMELELIEPELFFRQCPEAAQRLAHSVVNQLRD